MDCNEKRTPHATRSRSARQHWPQIFSRLTELLRPPPNRDAAAWADACRREPSHATRAGQWETSLTPYWLEPLRAASDWRCRRITAITGSQSGKTSTLLSLIGARFDDGPRLPALLVMPTQKLARSFSQDRLKRLIEDTPSLNRIHAKGKRDSSFEKWLGGVPMRLGWAGSATELASHPVGLVLVDELDRMLSDVGGEGNPLTLARARTITYRGVSLVVVTSSPTVEDVSAIQAEFDSGSREVAEWPCLHCGEYHRPLSRYLRWPDKATPREAADAVRYVCPMCGAESDDDSKSEMLARFRYAVYRRRQDGEYQRDDDADIDREHRSFWISGFLSPWLSFRDLARELAGAYASGDPATVQATLNTQFGELYRTRGDRPDAEEVARHRLDYAQHTQPHGVQFVTVGVDVQRDRLYYVARGWGCEAGPMESWLIDWGELHGSTDDDHVYEMLDAYLRDVRLSPLVAWIDSGYKPGDTFSRPDHAIYSYARRSAGRAVAAKGFRKRVKPIDASLVDVSVGGRKIRNGVRLMLVDSTFFKSWIYSRIRSYVDEAPDLWHVPAAVSDDYMRQVVAEELIVKASGDPYFHAPRHRPNHYLDCEVLATAAAYAHLQTRRIEPLGKQPAAAPVAVREDAERRPALGRRGAPGQRPRGLV